MNRGSEGARGWPAAQETQRSEPEDANGKASVTWRAPSAVFAPYGSDELNAMARELDPVFEAIVRDATGG